MSDILEMRRVHGIGTAKAIDLYDNYQCRSIKDLQELVQTPRYNFSDAAKIGLKHFNDLQVAH